jgi:hypothetical protein
VIRYDDRRDDPRLSALDRGRLPRVKAIVPLLALHDRFEVRRMEPREEKRLKRPLTNTLFSSLLVLVMVV